jgi:hypothetical protein
MHCPDPSASNGGGFEVRRATFCPGEDHRLGDGDAAGADLVAVVVQDVVAAFGEAAAVVWNRLYSRPPAASRSAVGV